MKSALYDADERSMHLGKGAEVMLSEVRSSKLWNRQNTWHIMALIPFFLYGYFTCLNCNVFLTATSTFKKRKRVLFITWKVPRVHRRLATGQSSNHLRFGIF